MTTENKEVGTTREWRRANDFRIINSRKWPANGYPYTVEQVDEMLTQFAGHVCEERDKEIARLVAQSDALIILLAGAGCSVNFVNRIPVKAVNKRAETAEASLAVAQGDREKLAADWGLQKIEIAGLKASLAESTKMFCCYCGAVNEKVAFGDGWNERMAHFLAEHLAVCPTHPARKYVELLALVSDLLAHDGGDGSEDYDGRKFVDARRKLMAARSDPNSPRTREQWKA